MLQLGDRKGWRERERGGWEGERKRHRQTAGEQADRHRQKREALQASPRASSVWSVRTPSPYMHSHYRPHCKHRAQSQVDEPNNSRPVLSRGGSRAF